MRVTPRAVVLRERRWMLTVSAPTRTTSSTGDSGERSRVSAIELLAPHCFHRREGTLTEGAENSKTKDPAALQKQLELGEHMKKGKSNHVIACTVRNTTLVLTGNLQRSSL